MQKNTLTAVIEIPKGDTRRRHLNYAKTAFEDFGAIIDKIPVNGGVMPVDYGFIAGTHNAKEGDEVDAIILADRKLDVAQELLVIPIALLKREDGDDKVLVADAKLGVCPGSWEDVDRATRDAIVAFFGYNHKFVEFGSAQSALDYISKSAA